MTAYNSRYIAQGLDLGDRPTADACAATAEGARLGAVGGLAGERMVGIVSESSDAKMRHLSCGERPPCMGDVIRQFGYNRDWRVRGMDGETATLLSPLGSDHNLYKYAGQKTLLYFHYVSRRDGGPVTIEGKR